MHTTSLTPDGFYWMRDGVLSPEFCEGMIEKFEANPDDQSAGISLGGYFPEHKKMTDMAITGNNRFKEEDQTIYLALTLSMRDYLEQLDYCPWQPNLGDSGYQMQRACPGDYFRWHSDFFATVKDNYLRVITFIFYLNDVEEGGETEFKNGLLIRPKTGRLLIFPAEFSAVHQGRTPISNTKYFVTGWFHQTIDTRFTPAPFTT